MASSISNALVWWLHGWRPVSGVMHRGGALRFREVLWSRVHLTMTA